MTVALFVIVCILQAGDLYTTLRAIKLGAVEANPVLVKLLGKRPKAAGLLAVKLGVTVWMGYTLAQSGWQADNDYIATMIPLALLLGWAVKNNLGVIKRLS